MFTIIDIALVKDKIALSTEGVEYEILSNETPTCLIVNQLLQQLKLSTLKYGFAMYDDRCLYLRAIHPELEMLDESIRFNVNTKLIFNLTDIYLLNKLLIELNLSEGVTQLYVKWNKKLTVYSDVLNGNNASEINIEWLKNHLKTVKDSDVLDQRFWILINHSFLNKLKSYTAFWKGKYNIEYILPDWYQKLYQHTKT